MQKERKFCNVAVYESLLKWKSEAGLEVYCGEIGVWVKVAPFAAEFLFLEIIGDPREN